MTDGQTHETPQDMPGRRALGAMESAVLRARASQGGVPSSPPTPPTPPPNPRRHPQIRIPTRSGAKTAEPAEPDRWLITSLVVVAALLVAASIALAVSLTGGGTPTTPLPSTSQTPTHSGATPAPGQSHAGGHHTSSGTSTNTSTTAPISATPGGSPVISSLTPSSGTAGQSVQVAGANFLSSSGQIVATFNGQVASTSCPAENACTVTVPPSAGAATVQVTITTASGTSNAVTFKYQ